MVTFSYGKIYFHIFCFTADLKQHLQKCFDIASNDQILHGLSFLDDSEPLSNVTTKHVFLVSKQDDLASYAGNFKSKCEK